MISIEGYYYDGLSSAKIPARLSLNELQNIIIVIQTETKTISYDELSISPRVGNTSRVIYLASGERFETVNNAGVDELIKSCKGEFFFSAHAFESSVKLIVLSVIFFVGSSLVLLKWGVPAASKHLAHQLPASFSRELSEGVLDQLDSVAFTESELDNATRSQIKSLFAEAVPADTGFNFNLQFRKSDNIGANAFALPDGTIVVTDEIVALMDDSLELQSVLYHEVGHVLNRHSLRSVIESLGIGAILSLMFGDINAASEIILTLPYILVQTSYSREKEREADHYALEHMLAENKNPIHFANMMEKLQHSAEEKKKRRKEKKSDKPVDNHSDTDLEHAEHNFEILKYFSTHPATSERIEVFKNASAEAGY